MDTTTTPTISPADFNALLGRADAPWVLDVRRRARFDESPSLLAAARYCAPEDVAAFAAAHSPRTIAVYCVYGHNVSADAVATLRAAGWNAFAVAGGIEGGQDGEDAQDAIAQWRASPVLRIAKCPEWGVTGERPSHWVTRARPKIDRLACPWLILRFIDPQARFHYRPAPAVLDFARAHSAVAFDIPGAPISHVGDMCSLDALLHGFALRDAALDLLATIVRGADTDRLNLAPQCAGLLAVSLGLARLHPEDDQALLAAALPLYDALYAWCRDRVAAQDETHNWNPAAIAGARA